MAQDRFSALRTHVRVLLDVANPLTWELRSEEVIFVEDSAAFLTRPPEPAVWRWVLARYPEDRRHILLSGYLTGEDLLTRRAAAVEVGVIRGRVALLGFQPAHRAQTHRTFQLLLKALNLAVTSGKFGPRERSLGPSPHPALSGELAAPWVWLGPTQEALGEHFLPKPRARANPPPPGTGAAGPRRNAASLPRVRLFWEGRGAKGGLTS